MTYILVAEDDPLQARLVQQSLEEAGHLVRVVHDDAAALAAVRARPPALVVLDVMLPGPGIQRVGDLIVDGARHRVTVSGREVEVTLTEFRILQTLAATPNRPRTRAELLDGDRRADGRAAGRAVDGHIRRLRVKIGQDRIETVYGVGYRMPV